MKGAETISTKQADLMLKRILPLCMNETQGHEITTAGSRQILKQVLETVLRRRQKLSGNSRRAEDHTKANPAKYEGFPERAEEWKSSTSSRGCRPRPVAETEGLERAEEEKPLPRGKKVGIREARRSEYFRNNSKQPTSFGGSRGLRAAAQANAWRRPALRLAERGAGAWRRRWPGPGRSSRFLSGLD